MCMTGSYHAAWVRARAGPLGLTSTRSPGEIVYVGSGMHSSPQG